MKKQKVKGFTLIELMIVIAIIAILAAIAIPNIIAYRNNANRAKCIGNLKQIQNAVEGYHAVKPNMKASDTVALADLCGTTLWLKETPSCPAAGEYKDSYKPASETESDYKPTCSYSNTDYPHELD